MKRKTGERKQADGIKKDAGNRAGKAAHSAKGMRFSMFLAAVLLAAPLLSACGGKAGNGGTDGTGSNAAGGDGEVYYRITETSLPSPNREAELILPEGCFLASGWVDSTKTFLNVEGTLYRIATMWGPWEEYDMWGVRGQCVQYLEAPYTEWENLVLDGLGWQEDAYGNAVDMQVTQDGCMEILLKYYTGPGEWYYGLGELHKDGTQKHIKNLTEEEAADWFGQGQADEESDILSLKMDMAFAGADTYSLQYAYGQDGELYFADVRHFWKYGKEEPELLLTFTDQDIVLDELYGISATEDGFLVMGGYKEKCFLLTLTESEEPFTDSKQEIQFYIRWATPAMKEVVANFNRQDADYRVVLTEETGQQGEGYAREIQMQVSAGGGPDILGMGTIVDPKAWAEKGYLAALDGVVQDEEDLWDAAMKNGVTDGVRYGLPYLVTPMFLVGYSDLIGERDRWDTREMMQAVEESGAEYLCYYWTLLTGEDIVYYFGLLDDTDKTYIDWEAGESHLTEDAFLELLEFAKKYAVEKREYGTDTSGPELRDGKIALRDGSVSSIYGLLLYESMFQGKEAYIGFPSAEGSGVYLRPEMVYVNAFSEHKEGAERFLKYLLTEDAQLILGENDVLGNGFSVRESVVLTNLERTKRGLDLEGHAGTCFQNGIVYELHALSEEQGERFLKLMESAEPADWEADRIQDIVYEELEPYFLGQRSAKEAAEILDNRVQLYLNERKNDR